MNYYAFHTGDYASATRHLSWDEDAAYRRLLDSYYVREAPIPADRRQAYRLVGAASDAQREAVDTVLEEFFELREDGWHNERCDEEIAAVRIKSDKASQSANKRWRNASGADAALPAESDGNANASANAQAEPCERIETPSEGNAPNPNPNPNRKKPSASSAEPTPTIPCPYELIVERYHERLPMLPRIRLMPDSRQKAMRKVWGWVLSSTKRDGSRRASNADEALHWLDEYFALAAGNDFLTGRTQRGGEHQHWKADFDFLLTERGMKHVIERTQEAA